MAACLTLDQRLKKLGLHFELIEDCGNIGAIHRTDRALHVEHRVDILFDDDPVIRFFPIGVGSKNSVNMATIFDESEVYFLQTLFQ